MTKNFYTIVHYPYEGCLITEFPTKADALEDYRDAVKSVEIDPLKPTNYLGVALVKIEVIDEKGDWKEFVSRSTSSEG